MVFSWFAHAGSVTPVGGKDGGIKRGFFVVCPYGLSCHPVGGKEGRKKEKNHTVFRVSFCGLPSLGAWSFVGGGPQAGAQRTPFSESLVCFLSLTESEISADSEFRIVLFEGSRQCPWCMHRARVLGVKAAGERYALKKVAQLRKEKDVLAM